MLRTTQSAADPIEERAFGFMAHRLRHIREARRDDELRQLPREVVRELRLLECRCRGLRLGLRGWKRVADCRSRDGQSSIAQDVAAVRFVHGWPPIVQTRNCASASWR